MSELMQQKQLGETLTHKVNKVIYSENRAFDRRVILEKNAQIWKELEELECNFVDSNEASVLRLEGQTAKMLANWNVITGTHNLIDFNSTCAELDNLKKKYEERMLELTQIHKELMNRLK